jgi:hypothetical protein
MVLSFPERPANQAEERHAWEHQASGKDGWSRRNQLALL